MTDEPDRAAEFGAAEQRLAEHLSRVRPFPPAAFRGRLGRHLAERDPGYAPRPAHLRLMVACYIGAGSLLIALGALGVS
jgi:hypothetical protein